MLISDIKKLKVTKTTYNKTLALCQKHHLNQTMVFVATGEMPKLTDHELFLDIIHGFIHMNHRSHKTLRRTMDSIFESAIEIAKYKNIDLAKVDFS